MKLTLKILIFFYFTALATTIIQTSIDRGNLAIGQEVLITAPGFKACQGTISQKGTGVLGRGYAYRIEIQSCTNGGFPLLASPGLAVITQAKNVKPYSATLYQEMITK